MAVGPPERGRVVAARNADFVVFTLAGIEFAAWASRIADAKAELHLTPGELGLTLLAASLGSMVSLPSAGRIAHRFGVVRAIAAGMAAAVLGSLLLGAGVDVWHSRPVVGLGLFCLGTGVGVWDVSMNLEGATVERLLGQSVMPRFHAFFSGGTVLSALAGAAMSWAHVSILAHLAGAGVVVAAGGWWSLRAFLPRAVDDEDGGRGQSAGARERSAWLEPRTLLIGVVTLVAAFTEGTANDWLAVAFVEGHDLPSWAGVLGFATFLSAMTLGRVLGTGALDRFGRVPVLRVCFALAVAGSILVVVGPVWAAYVGACVWGIGVALGFPVGISASADDPRRAPARMSVVATIGYLAFIAGPPVLGFLGDHVGVLHALLAVGTMAVLVQLVLPAVREPQRPVARAG
jgi:MFS family permease